MIQEQRIQLLNSAEARKGDYVLYWMQQSQRAECNHALEYSIERANGLKLPVIVYFGIIGSFPEANARHLAFMLQGDQEYDEALGYCRQLLAAYPGSRSTLRMMRDMMFKAGRYEEAVQLGAVLDTAIPRAFPDDKYCIAENWDVTGKAYAKMGQKEEARKRFNRVIAWEKYQDSVPWLARYVSECRQWLKRLG